ncbi:MAG: hypothetical protein ACKOYC_00920, partial [Bacteroidota bacterium]
MKIIRTLLLVVLSISASSSHSQGTFDMGLSMGITNYYGDLGHDDWFKTNSTQPGVAITFRNFLKPGAYS